MASVTIASGTSGQFVTLNYDTTANVALAQKLAAAISAGVQSGTILPAVDSASGGSPPPLPHGATGQYIQTNSGQTVLPPGYKAFVDTAQVSIVYGSGDTGESVLGSSGDMTFFATGGSGTVVGGGGRNRIFVPPTDKGGWTINLGNGNNIVSVGSGNNSIITGTGHDAIALGSGDDTVQLSGDTTVFAGSGNETIGAIGKGSTLIFGNTGKLNFVDSGTGSATIIGGTGSVAFVGGAGPDVVHGGSHGNNSLMAGTGSATLFGGGSGDQLEAMGSQGQALHASVGNETLSGIFASGNDTFYAGSGSDQIIGGSGNDTFVAGSGSATMTAGIGKDLFVFTKGQAGGTELIQQFFSGLDKIDLQGYPLGEVAGALQHQHVVGNSVTITLSDNTSITFAGLTSLSASDFITTPGGMGGHH